VESYLRLNIRLMTRAQAEQQDTQLLQYEPAQFKEIFRGFL